MCKRFGGGVEGGSEWILDLDNACLYKFDWNDGWVG